MYKLFKKTFARIKLKRLIKRLERDLMSYSWYIGVEKNADPELMRLYHETDKKLGIAKLYLIKLNTR